MTAYLIERMNQDSFDWLTWRNGSLHDLGVTYRTSEIIRSRKIILRYAVGYCRGHELICRPKKKHTGVMFFVNEMFFWTHLTNVEFEKIFSKEII